MRDGLRGCVNDALKERNESAERGHRLKIEGSSDFKEKVRQALKLVRAAGYYDFLRNHIRCIKEINGLTQLRVSEATIWANKYAVENPVDAAGRFIQEAYRMKIRSEGKYPHEGIIELKSFEKRIEFLKKLMEKSRKQEVKSDCERLIKMWNESLLIY
jgi:exonuclease III